MPKKMTKVTQVRSIASDVSKYTKTDLRKEVLEDVEILRSFRIEMPENNQYDVDYINMMHTLGQTKKHTAYSPCDDRYTIMLNKDFMKHCKPEEVHCTIMHEVIHTAPDCMNHGHEWKAIAEMVNKHYSFLPNTRTSSYDDWSKHSALTAKYVATCLYCGHAYSWERSSKAFKCCKEGRARCQCGCMKFACVSR